MLCNLLKITGSRILSDDMGRRPFDSPILRRGSWFDIEWFIQPKADTPVGIEEHEQFIDTLKKHGYRLNDPNPHNLGTYGGRVCLLDPWAASRIGVYE
jgi:hypothetical protein